MQGVSPELSSTTPLSTAEAQKRGEKSDDSFFESTPSHSLASQFHPSDPQSHSREVAQAQERQQQQQQQQQQQPLLTEAAAEKREALLGGYVRSNEEQDPTLLLSPAAAAAPPPRSVLQLLCVPEIAVAIVCGMAAQWIMVRVKFSYLDQLVC